MRKWWLYFTQGEGGGRASADNKKERLRLLRIKCGDFFMTLYNTYIIKKLYNMLIIIFIKFYMLGEIQN